ncbi:hypothetical protein BJV82DRAFT_606296 [Fennellomyces sp. T-0311]|nr:hypothetical protein BJV82DRAFT_606296 [Fennellomyces sp. T-0311]
MLCTSEQAFAQAARHLPSTHSSTTSNPYTTSRIPLLDDPYDPRIEQEYEQLVQDWTQQLLARSRRPTDAMPIPASTNDPDHPNHLYMDIIERYLEEQWVDSQHMLKCAQAWNGRDSLSLAEAVRAMNIVSLRLMQRTLDTRHMLNSYPREEGYAPMFSPWAEDTESEGSVQWRQQHHSPSLANLPKHPIVQDAPKGMVANTDSTVPRISLALSVDDYEDEHEMHAPLLRRYQTSSAGTSLSDWTHDKLKKKPSLQTIEQQAAAALSPPSRRPVRLVPSPSAPSCSTLTDEQCFSSFAPATNYHRYYPHWSEEESIDEHKDEEDEEWKSWFNHHDHQQPSCAFCYSPVPKKSLSAGDAEETRLIPSDHSIEDNQSTSYHTALDKTEDDAKALLTKNEKFADSGKCLSEGQDEDDAYNALVNSYGMSNTIIRSESSISAFRPISKNLAPRCTAARPTPYRDSVSSSTSSTDDQQSFKSRIPTITKSQSFPSKVAGMSSASSRPALPSMTPLARHEAEKGSVKERNFVMRSIVSKKASLSKLFSAKKY